MTSAETILTNSASPGGRSAGMAVCEHDARRQSSVPPIEQLNRRILIVDDNAAIHADFRKILAVADSDRTALEQEAAFLFGDAATPAHPAPVFELYSAFQGQEALEAVHRAKQDAHPFAVAFVDVRMPPGWDGVETSARLWEVDPELQVVICTAYSDYAWSDMLKQLGHTDRLLILKKPFDNVEVSQLAVALTAKWMLARQASRRMEELEECVRERTRELQQQKEELANALARLQEAHAQLVQSDKMASIGQLAAGVAHEINNPIGFISNNLNSLARYIADLTRILQAEDELLATCLTGPPEVQAVAAKLRNLRAAADIAYLLSDGNALIKESIEGTQRVRQIVADLRDFSHIDTPDVNEEDINRLLDKTINVCWNELKYKAEVVREYGDLPPVRCYGGKLAQVFLNLLVNAAQAIEEHGTITVRTGRDRDQVWVEVADTGCGIPPENLRRIFEPFFTTKEVGKGTGMGLHLAYKIVEAHRGRILVESELGRGSTFRVELPISGPPEPPQEKGRDS